MSDFNIEIEAQLQQEAFNRSINRALQQVRTFTSQGKQLMRDFASDAQAELSRIDGGSNLRQLTSAASDLKSIVDSIDSNITVSVAGGAAGGALAGAGAGVASTALAAGAGAAVASKLTGPKVDLDAMKTAEQTVKATTKAIAKQDTMLDQLVASYKEVTADIKAAEEELKRLIKISPKTATEIREITKALAENQAKLSTSQQKARLLGKVLDNEVALGSKKAAQSLEKIKDAAIPRELTDISKGFQKIKGSADKAAKSTNNVNKAARDGKNDFKRFSAGAFSADDVVRGLMGRLGGLGTQLRSVAASVPIFGGALSALTGPVGLAVAGVTALVGVMTKLGLAQSAVFAENILFARQIGADVNTLAHLEAAIERAGGSTEELRQSMRGFLKILGDANRKGGEAADAFAALGLNTQELAQLDPAVAFEKVIQALTRVKDASQRASLASAVGTEALIKQGRILTMNAAGWDKNKTAAGQYVTELDKIQQRGQLKLDTQIRDVGSAWTDIKETIAVGLNPELRAGAKLIEDFLKEFKKTGALVDMVNTTKALVRVLLVLGQTARLGFAAVMSYYNAGVLLISSLRGIGEIILFDIAEAADLVNPADDPAEEVEKRIKAAYERFNASTQAGRDSLKDIWEILNGNVGNDVKAEVDLDTSEIDKAIDALDAKNRKRIAGYLQDLKDFYNNQELRAAERGSKAAEDILKGTKKNPAADRFNKELREIEEARKLREAEADKRQNLLLESQSELTQSNNDLRRSIDNSNTGVPVILGTGTLA